MKLILASIIVLFSTIAAAVAAETTERTRSLPDANPVCMEVNGPDCVLKGSGASPPAATPRDAEAVVPNPAPQLTPAPDSPPVIIMAPPAQR